MAARSKTAPDSAYALAAGLGLLVAPYMYALAALFGEIKQPDAYVTVWPFFWVAFAVAHAALGLVLGLLWPAPTWRWGVWVCGAPLCLLSFDTPGALFYAGWVAVSLVPSCACAYAAGRYGLRHTSVQRPW